MNRFALPLAAVALFFAFSATQINSSQEKKSMNVKRITPVLLVKEIEPVLSFWVDRLGFTKTIEIPDGNKLVFVSLQKGNTEVMYQTFASVEKDAPKEMAEAARKGPTYLYMEVDDLDFVLSAMKDAKIVMPLHTAFYGMREFGVQDPAGHFITLAQPVAPPAR
ncbi:MAG TPA: VOC family protein [Candidatus Acidoferrum sp.]|jgi:uncharacterized glyoxalase superfamily protein PhnB